MISSPPAYEQPHKAETTAALLLRSHLPPYLPNREFDVYVADGAAFPDLVERCERLLRAHPVVYVHAVGKKCIPVAVSVAEQLREDAAAAAAGSGGQSKLVKVESYTQAVDITDDYRPLGRGERRRNTAVHLRISRPTVVGTE